MSLRLLALAAALAIASSCGSRVTPSPTPPGTASTPLSATTPAATSLAPTFTATVRPSPFALPRALAGVRLAMTQPEVRAALGNPQSTGAAPGSGLLQWQYATGVSVEFSEGPPITTSVVDEIDVAAPFPDATSAGLHIGDSRDAFRKAYAAYPLVEIENITKVTDDDGVTVLASFDTRDRLTTLGLFQGDSSRR